MIMHRHRSNNRIGEELWPRLLAALSRGDSPLAALKADCELASLAMTPGGNLTRSVVLGAQGMSFLHGGFIGFHGRLKSTACLIDARFVVKISNFGLRELRKQVTPPEIENPRTYARRPPGVSFIT
ncbi:hypothetical protein MTO96_013473 [Rhipicephalus appendiculatus]